MTDRAEVGSDAWREVALKTVPELVIQYEGERSQPEVAACETPRETWRRVLRNWSDGVEDVSDGLGVLGPGVPGGR